MSICIGIYGSSLIPIIGVGNSFAAMEFLPISPAASIGIIQIANSVICTVLTFLISYLVNVNKWVPLLAILACNILSAAMGVFVKDTVDLKQARGQLRLSFGMSLLP